MNLRKIPSNREESDLTNALSKHLISSTTANNGRDSVYKIADFVLPVKGFFDFMSRNSRNFITSDNCARDFAYTLTVGAWQVGYSFALYSGISKLIE